MMKGVECNLIWLQGHLGGMRARSTQCAIRDSPFDGAGRVWSVWGQVRLWSCKFSIVHPHGSRGLCPDFQSLIFAR